MKEIEDDDKREDDELFVDDDHYDRNSAIDFSPGMLKLFVSCQPMLLSQLTILLTLFLQLKTLHKGDFSNVAEEVQSEPSNCESTVIPSTQSDMGSSSADVESELALILYDENKIRMLEKQAFHDLKTLQSKQEKFMEKAKEVSCLLEMILHL